ncbi:MAG: amino acid permease [Saprospiraceae bacterium]|nr:amino acid permease [Saprospiraceae bacterium]
MDQNKKSLGLLDATMIVAGSMIGSGIFIVSADITRNVGSAGFLLLVWIITGVLTLIAATSYGELSAMYPKAGGQYVYLREAYGSLVSFLYGWSFFTVIQTGTIAAVGVAFSKFAAYIFPALSEKNILLDLGMIKISAAQIVSILLIVFLSWVNTRGIQGGKWIQLIFTAAKLLALFALIVFGFIVASKSNFFTLNWLSAWQPKSLTSMDSQVLVKPLLGFSVVAAIGVSMVGSVFSSDAWNNVTFIAGEIKNPQRNIGLSLILGTLSVTIIYFLANLMFVSLMPMQDIAFAKDDRIGVVAANIIFGNSGTYIIAILIMISTFGCNNGLILAGARVYSTMANDKLFFQKAAVINENGVPANGIWFQCIWASILCLTGKYGDLLDYVVFVVLLFYILTIVGIFILRRRLPEYDRPYKALGYPVLPLIYIIAASVLCLILFMYKPAYTWPGLGIVLLGIPVYYWAKKGIK